MMLTQARLKEVLHYDPDTGLFRWLVTNSNRAVAGSACLSRNGNGYVQVGIDGRRYEGQRLAWLYMTGEWPAHLVDHVDMDQANNRWTNLRAATLAENMVNTRARRAAKGIRSRCGRYQAHIGIDGKQVYLGTFDTAEAASAAYEAAARNAFGAFARAA